jgi:hypothetical protein
MANEKVQFRPGPLLGALVERADAPNNDAISDVSRRDLTRYYELLSYALLTVDMSEGEAGLIVDAMNGTIMEPISVAAQMLHYSIDDSLEDGLAEKWEVDGPALVGKLQRMSLLQRAAVCDAVERFWANAYHVDNIRARLVRVGLVKH